MEHMKFETPDMVAGNIEKIGVLFPAAITEMGGEDGQIKKGINFEVLKQLLSRDVVDGDECYEFTWVGKKAAMAEAARPITKTLRPVKEDSRDWDTTQNLYIEGDNLEALKILQESYLGKVKMIYIDPPYNTGHDFIYRDNFRDSLQDFETKAGQRDSDDNLLFQNSESNGRFHSDWCSMIYSRLILARNLLSDDGVIFISIDDSEVDNISKICNDVFGSNNFYAKFIWQRRSGSMDSVDNVSIDHEYILCYAKVKDRLKGIERTFSKYTNPDNDPRGPWIADNLTAGKPGGDVYYPIVDPDTGNEFYPPKGRYWPYSRETMKQKILEGRIIFPKTASGRPMLKRFQNEAKNLYVPVSTIMRSWSEKDIPNNAMICAPNTKGTSEMQELFGDKVFSFPKSTILLKSLLQQGCDKDSIILDFFSGSATTAHAVMQLNAEDNGQRKFIMIQLPESCDEKSEAFKAGYKNICEIGKERIRRAGDKIKEANPLGTQGLDIGFRVFRVDSSNMKDVYYQPEELEQQSMFDLISNIKDDRTDLDLLYACLLDWGVEIHLPHASTDLDGCTVHNVDNGALMACFSPNVPRSVVEYMAKQQPLRAVFRDDAFGSDDAKINVCEIFKLLSHDTKVKII